MKIFSIVGALLLTFASHAEGQRRQPTDVELRASYCLPVVNYYFDLVKSARSAANSGDRSSTLEIKEMIDQRFAEQNDRVRRLQAYILPKIGHIDATAISVAMKRGEEDVAYVGQLARTCGAKCGNKLYTSDYASCMSACGNNDERNSRMQRQCDSLDWLPF